MSPDHLCEEGLTHREDIKIPFHVIFSFSTILPFLYGIHFIAHFYFFGLTIRILTQAYKFVLDIPHAALLVFHFAIQSLQGHNLQNCTLPRVETMKKII